MESEPRNTPPSEVVRTKRLEVVDDQGKVRALIETRENGVTDFSIRDANGTVRASLEVGEIYGEASGLRLFDTNGKSRAVISVHNDPQKRAAVHINDGNEKDRAVTMSAQRDGIVTLMLTGEGAPIAALSLNKQEGTDPEVNLLLTDKDGNGGIVMAGRRHRPLIRFKDPRGTVRAGLELNGEGELELTSFNAEGQVDRSGGWLDRVLGEASVFYRALVFGAFLVVSAIVGAWIASIATTSASGVAGAGSEGLTFGTVVSALVVIAVLAALLVFLARQRR